MNLASVRMRVAEIIAHKDDPEKWHSMRDDLYTDILKGMVAGHRGMRDMAICALTLEFDENRPAWEAAG